MSSDGTGDDEQQQPPQPAPVPLEPEPLEVQAQLPPEPLEGGGPQDKRKEPRYEVSTTVPATWAGPGSPVECAASDISRHGIFLEMPDPPPVETKIRVGPPGADVGGHVVFQLTAQMAQAMGRRAGVGVQLDDAIDPDTFLLRCRERDAEERVAPLVMSLSDIGGVYIAPGPAPAPSPPLSPPSSSPAAPPPLPGTAPAAAAVRPALQRKRPVVEKAEAAGPALAEVVVVDGVDGEAMLAQALAADDYAPLIARHGLEGLALCLRRRPLLCITGAKAPRFPGRFLVEAIRAHRELDDVAVVLVDPGPAPDPAVARVARWRDAPADVTRARRLIDDVLADARAKPGPPPAGADDARTIAETMALLGRRLDMDEEHEPAEQALRYAAELAPTVSSHTILLARLLIASPEVKERAEGASLIERVCRQDPRAADAYLLRACVLDQRGRKEDARASLRRCLAFSPGNEEALAALERLEAGEPLMQMRGAPTPASDSKGAKAEGDKGGGWLGKLFKR